MKDFARRSLPAPRRRLALVVVAQVALATTLAAFADLPDGPVTPEQVQRGRIRVMNGGCADCHNDANVDPADPKWLSGSRGAEDFFQIGPFKTYARNLTPDTLTGLGRIAPRQVFNALRFGLKPADTPDVVISSNTPGQGNYPGTPHYLAPPMPWPTYRYMPDNELWDLVAYLKHGIKPVSNKATDSQGPPDFWKETYAPIIGKFPLVPFPAANEEFQP